ncbi:MAG: hypothetical protein KHY39_05420 [Clostridiaceae bacterium]|nr:hypothetical protein [Clostridiaceae bacterium]
MLLSRKYTSEETDVAGGKIAPGTSGYVDLYVKNDSEVTATYNIGFKSTNDGKIPLKYAIAAILGGNAKRPADDDWKDDILTLTKSGNLGARAATVGYRLYWKWNFDNSMDAEDTALGIAGTATTTVTATVTATQID